MPSVDRAAFAALYAREYPRVLAYLGQRQPHAAEDLAQETFLHAWRAWERFEVRDEPSTHAYLLTTARRLLIDHWRHQRHTPPRARPTEDGAPREPEVPDPHGEAPHAQVLDALLLAPVLARLTPKQRGVVTLRYGADLCRQEVARRLGCSDAATSKLHARALARLHCALEPAHAA